MKRLLVIALSSFAFSVQAQPYVAIGGTVGGDVLGPEIALGYRVGPLSFEAGLLANDNRESHIIGNPNAQTTTVQDTDRSWSGYRLGVKLAMPLTENLYAYARASGYFVKTGYLQVDSVLFDNDSNPATPPQVTTTRSGFSSNTVSPAIALGLDYRFTSSLAAYAHAERIKWKAGVVSVESGYDTAVGLGIRVSF